MITLNVRRNGVTIQTINLPALLHITDVVDKTDKSIKKDGKDTLNLIGMPLVEWEKMAIRSALDLALNNRQQAAKMLGIGERTLYRKLKLHFPSIRGR